MANTSDILAQIESIAAGTTPSTEQQQSGVGVSAALDIPLPAASRRQREGRGAGETEAGAHNAKLLGVAFVATIAQARNSGWPVQGAHPEGRAGQFVYERPDNTGFHHFLQPATLPQEFHVRSSLLEGTDLEEWRNDVEAEGEPTVFPNLDIVLANAQDSPKDFVEAFVDQGWATNGSFVGMLAHVVQQHIQKPTVQQHLDEHASSRKILIFDALLSFAQFDEGRKGDTLWFGCPVFPGQLLAVIQRRVSNQPGSAWQVPALDQTVATIGQVAQITDQARDLARNIVLNKSADWSEVRKLAAQGEEVKEAVQLFTSMSWEEACRAAQSTDLPTTLQLLQQRERRMTRAESHRPDRQGEGWSLPIPATGRPGTPTFFLAREPAEDEPKLTPSERDELEEACKALATTSIDIARARILAESTGVAIIALQPGGPDISRVKMPYYAENLLRNVQEEMSTCDSLRKVPLVTLAKVFSLRMTQNDNFVFEHLGLLISEDFSTEVTLTKMRRTAQGTHIIKAKKHKWAAVNTMEDLAHVVDGLVLCVKRFHHESVCSHQEISELWAKLRELFVDYGGHAHIAGLFRVFKTRIEEHVLAVRTRSQDETDPLPLMTQLQSRSQVIYNQVREAAKQQCLRDYVALRSGPGETAWGALRRGAETMDADGKRGLHSRPTQNRAETNRSPQQERPRAELPASAGPSSKRTSEQDDQQGRPRSTQKKSRRSSNAPSACVRCARPGHEWHDCNEREWCAIPRSWPGYLRSLAAKVRADKGVSIIYDEAPPPSTVGETVNYADGARFLTSKAPLFAGQAELTSWLADVQEAGRSENITGEVDTPHHAASVTGSDGDNPYRAAHSQMRVTATGWQDCAAVDERGWARIRRHPTQRYRSFPTFIVPLHLAKGVNPSQRPFPLSHQAPVTQRPNLPMPPPDWLKEEVEHNLQSWEDCISLRARQDLQAAVCKAKRDEVILTTEPSRGHRQRAKCGTEGSEVRIGPDQFHPTVNNVLRLGHTIDLTTGKPRIRELRKLTQEEWGINTERLLADARQITWPDEELLFFLEYGFMDYSGDTPPICSFSPHQQKAAHDFPAFLREVREEVEQGWIGPPQDIPPSVPFQVRPGSLEPKPGGRARLVWNASWPAPGSLRSTADFGNGWLPIAPNASTVLPSHLEFEWSAIETNNEVIKIMAGGAKASRAPLLGRTFDITKWFRQLSTATLDLWKCNVYVAGGFREDKRMQMGRRSSAHSAQRTTFLLTALLQRAAQEEKWGLRDDSTDMSQPERDQQRALKAWLRNRRTVCAQPPVVGTPHPPPAQAQDCLVYFSSFQDDITAVALGKLAAKDATEGVTRILQQKYGVPLSTREEATRDFAPTFTSIGATYDLSNLNNIECRPRKEKLAKYAAMLTALKQAGTLVPLLDMQRFAGLHTFMARFLQDGEFFCNSAYCCLRATPCTSRELRPVSKDMIKDADTVLTLLQRGSLAPLTGDPIFSHPGMQGFSADASGATGATAEGWGVHIQGLLVSGRWPAGIKRALANNKLSISPLELLAAAIAVRIAAQNSERLPARRQIILRSDSESTCTVVNSMRAGSASMLEALRIFKEAQDASGLTVRMQHISSAQNRISDNLSRGEREAAAQEASTLYNVSTAAPPWQLDQCCSRVLSAALQAARHSADTHRNR